MVSKSFGWKSPFISFTLNSSNTKLINLSILLIVDIRMIFILTLKMLQLKIKRKDLDKKKVIGKFILKELL